MDDQKNRRLFIAFITFILGLTLGGGLVKFCSGGSASDLPETAASGNRADRTSGPGTGEPINGS
jgi:hypothetical protein